MFLLLLGLPLACSFPVRTIGIRKYHNDPVAAFTIIGSKFQYNNNNKPDDTLSFAGAVNSDSESSSSSSVGSGENGRVPNFEPFLIGIRRDFGNRLPQYGSDFTDGLNSQTVATILFLFFACLAPAIGFGSVLAAATGKMSR